MKSPWASSRSSAALSLLAAACAAAAAAAQGQHYTLATCDLSSRESFKVSWTGAAAVIEQSDDLDASCLGLAAVGADIGAFPVACDGNAPLFEAVSMDPQYNYASMFFQVNTTTFAGMCLGTKVPAAAGALVFALPCNIANTLLAWYPSLKGAVRSYFNTHPYSPPPSGTPAFCLNATAVLAS
jgi:hypothetical protein